MIGKRTLQERISVLSQQKAELIERLKAAEMEAKKAQEIEHYVLAQVNAVEGALQACQYMLGEQERVERNLTSAFGFGVSSHGPTRLDVDELNFSLKQEER